MRKNYFKLSLLLVSGGALAQAPAATPLLNVNIEVPIPVCSPGNCTDLLASYTVTNATTSYIVESMPYVPSFPFTGGTIIPGSAGDDLWSATFTLPFNFCFYGNNYNQLKVGTNGVITFNTTGWTVVTGAFEFCPWAFSGPIPNASFPIRNAIYGVYQDTNIASPPVTNPTLQNVNYYTLDTGANAAPNRVFVANFNQLPQFQCSNSVGLQTSQIVLHEGTNIIEVFVQNRTSCTSWNAGAGVIGLQNNDGTMATVPPGRNVANWSATNEAWRFTPNGAPIEPQLSWFIDGVGVSENTNPLQICPAEEHIYTAMVNYDICGNSTTLTRDYADPIFAPTVSLANPTDISVCDIGNPVYFADINQDTMILNGQSPSDFEIRYYVSEIDAINGTSNTIAPNMLSSYPFSANQTIYVRIEQITYGCVFVKPFQLLINPAVEPPTGAAQQNFLSGQTLADLMVNGQNITWYDQAIQGNQLPSTTVLQNNATYYSSQTINNCESRNVQSSRLAVTVQLVLANQGFDKRAIAVYPNPANDRLNIAFADSLQSIAIVNTIGQMVATYQPNKKETSLDISGLQAGIYFVKINTASKQQTVKIIKK
ncbi:MAG TPA: T9SS type A sorting domain-containing protein [Flavobacterium sp.]|nr:T9SS type A sorting domain-containing protein [Flavobacterium sp.]